MTTVALPDDAAHQDNLLMARVGKLNEQLGRYLLRFLDADSHRATPISTADERTLADRVAELATAIQARADRRDHHGVPHGDR
jgi:hypothetical protein